MCLSDVKQHPDQLVVVYLSLDWLSRQFFPGTFLTDWKAVDVNNEDTSFECELCGFAHLIVFAFGTGVVSDVFRILKWERMGVRDSVNILLLFVLSFVLAFVTLEDVGSVDFEDAFEIFKKAFFFELFLKVFEESYQVVLCIFLTITFGKLFWSICFEVIDWGKAVFLVGELFENILEAIDIGSAEHFCWNFFDKRWQSFGGKEGLNNWNNIAF